MRRAVQTRMLSENRGSFLDVSLSWNPTHLIDKVEAGAEAPGRYLALLQVGDYTRLSDQLSPGQLLGLLDDEVARDTEAGRCLLVLDLSNEGPAFHKSIFDSLHQVLAARGIPRSGALLVTQNRLLQRSYERVYGGGGIGFAVHDFFVKLICVHLDREASTRLNWRSREFEEHVPDPAAEAKDFLCLNATPRWHRNLVFRHLQLAGLLDEGLVSFHGANPSNPKATMLDLSSIPPEIPASFPELIEGIERWMPRVPVRFDTDQRMGNDLASSLEVGAYRGSLYSIVTESDFFDLNVERVTEKAIKAAGLGHPFIIVGNPRSVGLLAELGFETFGAVLDHGYDREADHAARMRLVFREIARQQHRLRTDRANWIAETREAAQHNVEHARAGLLARYRRLVEAPLISRLERFVETGEVQA